MLIERMQSFEDYTEIEKNIMSVILECGEEIGRISIQELSELTFTSTTTILRFCRKLGFNGYKDFKLALLKDYSSAEESSVKVDVNRPFHFGANVPIVANNLNIVYQTALRSTMQMIDYDAVNRAADLMCKADRVFVFGTGDSGLTAQMFINRMLKIGRTFVYAEYEYIAYAKIARAGDLAVFVTYKGGNGYHERAIKVLKENHVPVITLSSRTDTLLARNSDVLLIVPQHEIQSDNIATFFSQECFSFCLNLIYSVVYTRHYLENNSLKKSVDELTSGKF